MRANTMHRLKYSTDSMSHKLLDPGNSMLFSSSFPLTQEVVFYTCHFLTFSELPDINSHCLGMWVKAPVMGWFLVEELPFCNPFTSFKVCWILLFINSGKGKIGRVSGAQTTTGVGSRTLLFIGRYTRY